MTNEQILEKSIEKAVLNGYKYNWIRHDQAYKRYYEVIFSHDFTKAFWKDNELDRYTECPHGCVDGEYGYRLYLDDDVVAWQFYLQQMVLEPEPLKYLAQFLDK